VLFVQFRFIVFFLIVFAVHWTLRSNQSRKVWLLISSHFFYACLFLAGPDSATSDTFPPVEFVRRLFEGRPLPTGWWFPVVLWSSTTMDYIVGLGIGRAGDERKRRAWLLVSILVNLGVLGFFKYANFCIDSVHTALSWFGLHTSKATLNIFLPYGISFYTFQSMSYSIDVYRRRLEPVKSFLDLAFFISFFPQLVAGPIVRAMTFLPQLSVRRMWENVDVRGCLTLFFVGFVKKACISENIAPIVDSFFAAPGNYDLPGSFTGVLFYAVQVYCDFSGYSDMAIATAGLLGYALTENFAFPYFSGNIGEHWRRWHISLSTWLRDYLYIPLGGNRGTKLTNYRNLTLTMVIGGLWHGASWTYVIWGFLQGLCLCLHREYKDIADRAPGWWQKIRTIIGPPLTFYFTCTAYCFFRAQNVVNPETGQVTPGYEIAGTALKSFVLFQKNGEQSFGSVCLWIFAGLAIIHWLAYLKLFSTWWRVIPAWLYTVLLAIGLNIALYFLPQHHKAFIYFQF
jgi:alginate O-acetyltransferase complex protein AlgI